MMTTASDQRSVRKGKHAILGLSNGGRWEPDLLHLEGRLSLESVGRMAGRSGSNKRCKKDLEAPESGVAHVPSTGSGCDSAKESTEHMHQPTLSSIKSEQDAEVIEGGPTFESASGPLPELPPSRDEMPAYHAPARPRNTWLSCDLCGKWRRLGKMKDSALPETWQCDQNPDAAYASCDVPQELPDDDIDRLLGLLPPKPVVKASGKRAERADEFAPMPGGAPPICGQSLGEVMDQLVKKAKLTEAESRTIHWHLANLEYGCATDLMAGVWAKVKLEQGLPVWSINTRRVCRTLLQNNLKCGSIRS